MSEPTDEDLDPLARTEIRGEFAPDDFYRALGCAIVTFTAIDSALWGLYWALRPNDPPDHEAARAMFYSSKQFGGRLDKVAALAEQKITDPAPRAEWTDIHAAVRLLKDERNHLVHSDAAADFEEDNTFGLALVRAMHMPGEKYTPPKAKLDTRRLEELVEEFEQMAARIDAFVEKISPDPDAGRYRQSTKVVTSGRRRRHE